MLSTDKVVSVPKLVIFDCAAVVTVAAVPETLPVTLPVTLALIACEKVKVSEEAVHKILASFEASTASCIVIPAPSAVELESPADLFKVIFLSSTSNVPTFAVIVSPDTVKSPVTVKSPAD